MNIDGVGDALVDQSWIAGLVERRPRNSVRFDEEKNC